MLKSEIKYVQWQSNDPFVYLCTCLEYPTLLHKELTQVQTSIITHQTQPWRSIGYHSWAWKHATLCSVPFNMILWNSISPGNYFSSTNVFVVNDPWLRKSWWCTVEDNVLVLDKQLCNKAVSSQGIDMIKIWEDLEYPRRQVPMHICK